MTTEDVGTFYWAAASGPEVPVVFRRTVYESATRAVEDICMAELSELARYLLASGKDRSVLVVAMARELGLQRTGTAVRTRLETAIALLAT